MLEIEGALTSRRLRWHLAQRRSPIGSNLEIGLAAIQTFEPEGLVALLSFVDGLRRHGRAVSVICPSSLIVARALARSGVWVELEELGAEHDLPLLAPAPSHRTFGVRRFGSATQLALVAEGVESWTATQSRSAAALTYKALCEAGENVLDHSGEDHGYLAADLDLHGSVRFAVSDAGMGFRRALAERRPYSDAAALRLALRGGASSTPRRGRGNGLSWLAEQTAEDRGELVLVSGSAAAVVADSRGSPDEPDLLTVPPLLPGALVRGRVSLISGDAATRVQVA